MPLFLHCDELEPGMRLAESIVSGGRVLLAGGKVLTHADVDILRQKHPNTHARVGDPILDQLVAFEDDSRDRKVAANVRRRIAGAMSEVKTRFSSRTSLGAINVRALHGSVAEVMTYLKHNLVTAALLSRTLDPASYLAEHTGNVFYLSMILGAAVRDYVVAERRRRAGSRWLSPRTSMNMLPLGLGAMLCDVGMFPLQHLYTRTGPLSDEDRQAIREHPVAGADLLPPDVSAITRAVVRSHHENFDGSGYPAGLKRGQIHIFSRIVRIADAYDAATATHVYKEAKTPVRALWEMSVGPYRRFYDPALMEVFTRLIQPFPIGGKLRLRDGRYGVVVRYNRESPLQPTVLIAFDVNGKRLPNDGLEGPLCLADRPDLRLQSFGDEQLSYLHGSSSANDAAPPRKDIALPFDAVFP